MITLHCPRRAEPTDDPLSSAAARLCSQTLSNRRLRAYRISGHSPKGEKQQYTKKIKEAEEIQKAETDRYFATFEGLTIKERIAQKKENPNMVATKGLYKIVRCPNYLGEIIFWTGVFVSGVTTYATIGQWITAIIAYICIVYIMFNGAKRIEKRQMARYGEDKEYNDYANKTPIIIPLLPIYHLNKK